MYTSPYSNYYVQYIYINFVHAMYYYMQYYHDLHYLGGIWSESRHSPCSDQYADTWKFWSQSTLKCEIVHMCTFVYIHALKGTRNIQDTMGNDKFHSLMCAHQGVATQGRYF